MILDRSSPDCISTLVQIFRNGGTAVLPCDTIYGLSAIFGKGEHSLRNLKGRSESKPFLLIATRKQALGLAASIPQNILNAWPAPLTAVLKSRNPENGTVAIRVPSDNFLLHLLEELGSPVYSTSVNISGEPALVDFAAICERFESLVDVMVKGPDKCGSMASTLIDATSYPFKVLRQGTFDVSQLSE